MTFLSLCRNNILSKWCDPFPWLKECEVTQKLTQLLLSDLSVVSMQCQEELCKLQQDESKKTLFKIKGTMMWKEIPLLHYFGKAKTDNIFLIFFGRMWL